MNFRFLITGIAVLAASLSGCNKGEPEKSVRTRVGIVAKSLGNGFFDAVHKGADEAGRELDAEVIFTGPTTPTAEGQIEVLNSLIAQRVDAIAVSANDPDALVPTLKRAMARGIKVISYDSGVDAAGRIAHLAPSSDQLIGETVVALAAELAPQVDGKGKGKFAVVSATPTSTNQNSWLAEMRKALPQQAGLELVSVVYGDDVSDKSYREAVALLKQHPDLAVLVSISSVGIVASARAVEDQGLTGKVKVTGLGLPSELVGYVEKGVVPKFAIWNPIDLGYSTMQIATRLARGDDAAKPVSMGRMGEVTFAADGVGAMSRPFIYDSGNTAQFAKNLLKGVVEATVEHSLLTLTDIRKSFGGVRALERACLDLPRGAITALIGENGAGKSTLVKILSGIYQPDAGEICFDGNAVRIDTPQVARALGIGVVHQECLAFDNLSVAENLFINAQPMRAGLIRWPQLRARAATILRDLDADFDIDMPAGRLSIAQKHVMQIARALTHESRVLIFDEPTASLSQRECAELFRIVRKLRDAGCALLFISHKFDEIFELADRYAVFRDGVSVNAGRVSEVSSDELISLMVGRPVSQLFPKVETRAGAELLRVEHLSRDGEFEDVSFTLQAGEILGLYGLVGAGRTELAQVLFGINSASSGAVTFAAGSAGVALVPEDRQGQGAVLPFSLAANIALPNLATLAPRGWCSAARESQLARQWIDRLSIKAQAPEQPVHHLSGGNQQKVVIAKWLARKPSVLILDEPTKGIDVGAKAAVHAVTSEFARAGGAVLMISSDLPEILGMSDRVMVMRRGRVRGHFTRAQATSESLLRAASDA